MSHQIEIVTRMRASTPLMAILTGGVYAAEELPPEEAISPKVDLTASAFDTSANGAPILKPCALVRTREDSPDGVIVDQDTQINSSFIVAMIHLLQHRGYDQIDLAKPILKTLFVGRPYAGVIDIYYAGTVERTRDSGALMGNSLERMDFQVILVS